MRLVAQADPWSCGVASLAMLLGRNYHDVLDLMGRSPAEIHDWIAGEHIGVFTEEATRIIWDAGYWPMAFHCVDAFSYWNMGNHWQAQAHRRGLVKLVTDEWLRREVLPDNEAMIGCPSLNSPGSEHWVAWDGARVLDPSRGDRVYDALADVRPMLYGVVRGPRRTP